MHPAVPAVWNGLAPGSASRFATMAEGRVYCEPPPQRVEVSVQEPGVSLGVLKRVRE